MITSGCNKRHLLSSDRSNEESAKKSREIMSVAADTSSADDMSQVRVDLEDRELWNQFYAHGTEMIITKPGRRMFPALKYRISGLDPAAYYFVLLDIVPADEYRYKFMGKCWMPAYKSDAPQHKQNLYMHPDSPALGAKWMRHPVGFYKVKLTNSQTNSDTHIMLNSMHKFVPRIHIFPGSDIARLSTRKFLTLSFPQTAFMAVTAYQNETVTTLKIQNNPFAKGFREEDRRNPTKRILDENNNEISKRRRNSTSSPDDYSIHSTTPVSDSSPPPPPPPKTQQNFLSSPTILTTVPAAHNGLLMQVPVGGSSETLTAPNDVTKSNMEAVAVAETQLTPPTVQPSLPIGTQTPNLHFQSQYSYFPTAPMTTSASMIFPRDFNHQLPVMTVPFPVGTNFPNVSVSAPQFSTTNANFRIFPKFMSEQQQQQPKANSTSTSDDDVKDEIPLPVEMGSASMGSASMGSASMGSASMLPTTTAASPFSFSNAQSLMAPLPPLYIPDYSDLTRPTLGYSLNPFSAEAAIFAAGFPTQIFPQLFIPNFLNTNATAMAHQSI